MQPPSRLGIFALLAFMPLFFVSNLVIGRAVATAVEPSTLAFWRWLIATLLLLPFAWRGLVANAGRFKALWRQLLLLGVLGMVLCGTGVYLSLRYTTASNAALIYASSSIFIVVMEVLFFGMRLSASRLLGTLIGFAGVVVIVLHGELQRLLTWEFNAGDIGIAIAAISWAAYSVILKRKELSGLPTLPLFAAIAMAGTLVVFPLMMFEAVAFNSLPAARAEWVAILALAIFPSALAFWLYQVGVKYAGPTVTGLSLYLLPVYGVGMAVLLLGERLYAYHAIGFVLVIVGIALATEPFKPRTA